MNSKKQRLPKIRKPFAITMIVGTYYSKQIIFQLLHMIQIQIRKENKEGLLCLQ